MGADLSESVIDLGEFLEGVQSGGRCTLCELIPKLSNERRLQLNAACNETERISGERIYRVLKGWGHGVGLSTVRRHRKECVLA